MAPRSRAVFLDRDGTISRYMDYCRRVEDLQVLPGAGEAIRLLNDAGWRVVVVTNQSGIARQYFTTHTLEAIHREMRRQLEAVWARVDAIYVCPHHPDDGCACRKPRPAMLLKAAADLHISLADSYVIGDRLLDVLTGCAAGTRTVLVHSGHALEPVDSIVPEHEAPTLLEAVRWILDQEMAQVKT